MKTINSLLIIILAISLNACNAIMNDSNDLNIDGSFHYQDVCPAVTDAVEFPVPWTVDIERTFVISDKTIQSMSTCGLLVTWLKYPGFRSIPYNDLFAPSVTDFNDSLRENKVAIELLKRRDCFPVLASKYMNLIEENKRRPKDNYNGEASRSGPYQIKKLEMLLASDMCMSLLDRNKVSQIMSMALENEEIARPLNGAFIDETYTLIISIMLWNNYTPFIEEVGPRIREGAVGYFLTEPNGDISGNCLLYSHVELILKYAKEFLNEQKL